MSGVKWITRYVCIIYDIMYMCRVQFTFRTLSGRVRFIFRTFKADGRHVLRLQYNIYIYSRYHGLYTRRWSRYCRGWWRWAEVGTDKSFLVRRWCKRTIYVYYINIYRYRGNRLWSTPSVRNSCNQQAPVYSLWPSPRAAPRGSASILIYEGVKTNK